jgi:hypothetical protein
MTVDNKVRIGLFLVSAAVSVFTAVAATHGLSVGFLDGIGGTGP